MILLMICWCKSAKADLWATSNWITLIALRSAASTFSFPLWLPGTAWVLRQFIETGFVRWRNYAYNIAESIYGPLYFLTYSMLLHLQHLPICKLTLWRITRWWDHIVMPLFLAVLRISSVCEYHPNSGALLLLSPMIQRFAVFPASKAPQQVPWLSWSRGAGPPKGPLSSAKGSPRIPWDFIWSQISNGS